MFIVDAHRVRNNHQTTKPRHLSQHLALCHITSPLPLQIPFILFLLGAQARGANVSAPQLDIEHSLHLGENSLVRRSSTALVCSNSCRCLANLLAQIGLGHSGLELLAGLLDSFPDVLSDCLGLDNVIGAVDLGQTLAFAAGALRVLLLASLFAENCCQSGWVHDILSWCRHISFLC